MIHNSKLDTPHLYKGLDIVRIERKCLGSVLLGFFKFTKIDAALCGVVLAFDIAAYSSNADIGAAAASSSSSLVVGVVDDRGGRVV